MNKRLRKKKGTLKPSINQRVIDLLIMCIENGLNFDYLPNSKSITIYDTRSKAVLVARGYIADWKYETPEEVTTRLEREVKQYVDRNKAIYFN